MATTTTTWIDCPRCGTAQATMPADSKGATARCRCGDVLPVRTITVRWTPGVAASRECPPECLNGRSDCSCRCGGRCHGRLVCACRRLSPWTPPHRVPADAQRPLFF